MLALDPLLLSFELPFSRPRIYHSVQLGLPAVRGYRAVVTIHDLAPLRWPEHYLRLPHSWGGHKAQYALAPRADAIIAVSAATKPGVAPPRRLGRPGVRWRSRRAGRGGGVHASPRAARRLRPDAARVARGGHAGRRLPRRRGGGGRRRRRPARGERPARDARRRADPLSRRCRAPVAPSDSHQSARCALLVGARRAGHARPVPHARVNETGAALGRYN